MIWVESQVLDRLEMDIKTRHRSFFIWRGSESLAGKDIVQYRVFS